MFLFVVFFFLENNSTLKPLFILNQQIKQCNATCLYSSLHSKKQCV